jgi:lipoate-protein ligase A
MLFEKLLELHDPQPHGAALNMAIDEVLLRSATVPLLRFYRWTRPAVSFGYFERWSPALAPAPQWETVRRWTGGGVVRHGEDVTYTLIVPAAHEFARHPAAESYRRIHEVIAGVLEAGGMRTALAAETWVRVPGGCFENAAEADVLAAGRKIAGAAQRRTRWGLLHQGSVQGAAIAEDFAMRLAEAFSAQRMQRGLCDAELAEAEALAAAKYATAAWQGRFA